MAVGAAGLGIIFVTGAARYDPSWALVLATVTAVVSAVVSALAFVRFSGSRDPHALLLAIGTAALAVQATWFGVGWPIAHQGGFAVTVGTSIAAYVPGPTGTAPVYAWQFGWVVAGTAFVLGNPWWERRGRPALAPVWTVGLFALVLMIGDLVLVSVNPGGRTVRSSGLALTRLHLDMTGPLRWILGIAAITMLVLASAREWGHRPPRALLSAAFLLAASLQIAVLAHPTPGLTIIQLADLAQPVMPLLVLGWLLRDQGAENSRSRRAEDRAEKVLSGRAEIASMIAHEVRGPVATVRGIANTSLAHYDRLSDQEHREFLSLIEQESSELLGAVDQMALGLKIDAGALRFDLGPTDLGDAVKAGASAVERGERLLAVVAEEGVTVHADPARLQEVVRQLVDNALKYSPPATPVTVRAVREGDHGLIEIADEGPGIPVDRRDQVTERFPNWRPSGYEDRPGTGLGLFICSRLVEEQRGTMFIEDASRGGTMLRVRIPLER
jgi:signal transduction histidine kinase